MSGNEDMKHAFKLKALPPQNNASRTANSSGAIAASSTGASVF